MEFKNAVDVVIAEKMLQFPLLGEQLENTWNLKLNREFDMTNDSYLFKTENAAGRLPLYEGKMIHQFTHKFNTENRYWIIESDARKSLLSKENDVEQLLDYQSYRLAFRAIARNTDSRTLISTLLPKNVFAGRLSVNKHIQDSKVSLFVISVFNSFVVDFYIRQKITTTLNNFYIYQLPIPRLTEKDPPFKPIVERAAALICTTPEFDDLRAELKLNLPGFKNLEGFEPAQLRAELDAIIAHLYGLTESEFAHILKTFPIVKEDVKAAAMVEFKKLAGEK